MCPHTEEIKDVQDLPEPCRRMYDGMNSLCEDMMEIRKDVRMVRTKLFGNGEIEHSIIHRLSRMEDILARWARLLDKVNGTLIGAIVLGIVSGAVWIIVAMSKGN